MKYLLTLFCSVFLLLGTGLINDVDGIDAVSSDLIEIVDFDSGEITSPLNTSTYFMVTLTNPGLKTEYQLKPPVEQKPLTYNNTHFTAYATSTVVDTKDRHYLQIYLD